jgi:hypothetical protein
MELEYIPLPLERLSKESGMKVKESSGSLDRNK